MIKKMNLDRHDLHYELEEESFDKWYKRIYKELISGMKGRNIMVCPNCGESRINKVAWEYDNLRKLSCIICWGWFSINIKTMFPCFNCKHNHLINEFFKDKKENWILQGKREEEWRDYYYVCTDCYSLRNGERFSNYKPQDRDVQCDECNEESRNGQLHIIKHFYNNRGGYLAVCYQCKDEKYTFISKKQFEKLENRTKELECKVKETPIIYCDKCGNELNLREL